MKITLVILCLLFGNASGPSEMKTYNVFGQQAINPYDNPGVDCSFTLKNSGQENIYYIVFDQEIFKQIDAGGLGKNRHRVYMGLSEHAMIVIYYDLRGVEIAKFMFKTKLDNDYILDVP